MQLIAVNENVCLTKLRHGRTKTWSAKSEHQGSKKEQIGLYGCVG